MGVVLGRDCAICSWTWYWLVRDGVIWGDQVAATSYLTGYALAREDVHLTLCGPHAEELRKIREAIAKEIPR